MLVVRAIDVAEAIDRYLADMMTAAELEAWAERREMAEDFEYAEDNRQAVADALFQLANPAINGVLNKQRVLAIRRKLLD